MIPKFEKTLLASTGANSYFEIEKIQSLWSGYGEIVRLGLRGAKARSVIIKHVKLPKGGRHPRGWNTNLSHDRKVRSYNVEIEWYATYSKLCDEKCRIPKCIATDSFNNEVFFVLEDLDDAGFPLRKTSVTWDNISSCLSWLANFHATFLGKFPVGLWDVGTYWHLDTRPEELEVLSDIELKNVAKKVDEKLQKSPFLTFVHGDAKLANFCFSNNVRDVAAVDFQYVGGGCGMKDVAYFVGSCLMEDDCEKYESKILDVYFNELHDAIEHKNISVEFNALEENWRELYPFAWTDFHRFLKGWSPGHWKINTYSERIARSVIQELSK